MEQEKNKIASNTSIISGKNTENENELAKTNFLARMNHEMRTPLNAIIGMSTIALGSDEPEKIAGCLTKINEASVHLLGMINDVLDMAKIEAGNLKLTNGEFNLPHMLRKTIDTRKFTLDEKKQTLLLDIDPELPETIVCDEQRLSQVLDNFLSNAVKFTAPEGIITFSVKKLAESAGTCTLELKVSDTGIGISEEEMKKIFAFFEQADGGMSRKFGGTGLGLAIATSIVQLMGGKIHVDSKPGEGSTFRFEITVKLGKKESRESFPSPANTAEDTPAQVDTAKLAGLSIMLVEDVEINREIVTSLLEDTGIIIESAENGLEACEKFRSDPSKYNLILMDIHMPEMDGYEATQKIRAFETELCNNGNLRTQVPIIAMTANVFKDDVKKCFDVGMTAHLGKPIDYEELMNTIVKYS